MGKAVKAKKPSRTRRSVSSKMDRPSLVSEINDYNNLTQYGSVSAKSLRNVKLDRRGKANSEDDENEPEAIPANLTAKIFKQARVQQVELNNTAMETDSAVYRQPFCFNGVEFDVEEMEDDHVDEDADVSVEMSPEDESMLSMYMSGAAPVRRTLADMIMEKIKEKEDSKAASMVLNEIPEKVVTVYSQVGTLMSRYRSGKLPKALKVIPSLQNWEQILHLTRPDQWTSQALAAITRLFASNLNTRMAQRFYNLVLLPRIRSDIESHKKLNFHLYMAMRKAVFKPAAFFKGIVLPLAQDACTAREAVIVCSILAKISIPMMHSGAALLKLSQMEYSGPTCMLIKTLINKKYSLPYQVVSGMVKYLSRFESDPRVLPVIWHQTFLVFAQRYKHVITSDHKECLKRLLKIHEHHQIAGEIRRELFAVAGARDSRAGEDVLDRRTMAAALIMSNPL